MTKAKCKESNQAQASGPTFDAPKKNHFNAFRSKGDLEDSPDVVISMLKDSPLMFMHFHFIFCESFSGYEVFCAT